MDKNKLLTGSRSSASASTLSCFEQFNVQKWAPLCLEKCIPDGFMFLVGVYPDSKKGAFADFRFGKERLFVQSMRPHTQSYGVGKTRGFGAIYALHKPQKSEDYDDDLLLKETAIYQALPDKHIKLVLADGEHRNALCVKKMFEQICHERGLQIFSLPDDLPKLYSVRFLKKSCGYFLHGRTYIVWALPIGIPDFMQAKINKGWIFCDMHCGIPAIIRADRESFNLCLDATDGQPLHEGSIVEGIYKLENNTLV